MESKYYPKSEIAWMGYYTASGELRYIVTSKRSNRDYYYLYRILDDKSEKLGRAPSPKELEARFDVMESLRKEGALK